VTHELYRDYKTSNNERDILIKEIEVYNHFAAKAIGALDIAIKNNDRSAVRYLAKILDELEAARIEILKRVTSFVKNKRGI